MSDEPTKLTKVALPKPIAVSAALASTYLSELEADETKLVADAEAYEKAKARLEVDLRRYTALRDFVAEQFGHSPYQRDVPWPSEPSDEQMEWLPPEELPTRGRFRFAGMKVGDAIVELLRERLRLAAVEVLGGEARRFATMSLTEIVEALSAGGLGFPDTMTARSVNAALMKTAGVARATKGARAGEYYYLGEEAETQQDDPPFE